jgi:phosphotransferase system  glucose/maltose/N-acetylglucosamine-specific IIC component
MVALIVGIVFIGFAIIAVLPFGLAWWADVLLFLRGALPVMAIFIGLIAVFIGIADIKDRIEAKKEEEQEKKEEAKKSEGTPTT